jgi:hypothetical protein
MTDAPRYSAAANPSLLRRVLQAQADRLVETAFPLFTLPDLRAMVRHAYWRVVLRPGGIKSHEGLRLADLAPAVGIARTALSTLASQERARGAPAQDLDGLVCGTLLAVDAEQRRRLRGGEVSPLSKQDIHELFLEDVVQQDWKQPFDEVFNVLVKTGQLRAQDDGYVARASSDDIPLPLLSEVIAAAIAAGDEGLRYTALGEVFYRWVEQRWTTEMGPLSYDLRAVVSALLELGYLEERAPGHFVHPGGLTVLAGDAAGTERTFAGIVADTVQIASSVMAGRGHGDRCLLRWRARVPTDPTAQRRVIERLEAVLQQELTAIEAETPEAAATLTVVFGGAVLGATEEG